MESSRPGQQRFDGARSSKQHTMARCWRRAWAAVKCGRSEAVRWPVHGCWGVPDAWGDQWHCAAATADAAAAAPPCAHEDLSWPVASKHPMASRQRQAGQSEAAIGHEAWPRASVPGSPSIQSMPEYPAAVGRPRVCGLRLASPLKMKGCRGPWRRQAARARPTGHGVRGTHWLPG